MRANDDRPAIRNRRPNALSRGLLGMLLLALCWPAAAEHWTSRDGRYRLSYDSELSPIVINRMHRWVLRLETADGQPVTGASFEVRGSMPVHDHGLPTQPRVTRELGDGLYLLEGMRFHMAGRWQIEVRIQGAAGADTALVDVDL